MPKLIIVLISDEEKKNETLSEIKTWLLSCSCPLTITEKAFFNTKLQGLAPKKEEIVIPFVSARYSNVELKSISIIASFLLSNVKDNRLKKAINKCKVIHALKQPRNLLRLFSIPNFKLLFLKSMACFTMNLKIPAVIYAHHIYKYVQVS